MTNKCICGKKLPKVNRGEGGYNVCSVECQNKGHPIWHNEIKRNIDSAKNKKLNLNRLIEFSGMGDIENKKILINAVIEIKQLTKFINEAKEFWKNKENTFELVSAEIEQLDKKIKVYEIVESERKYDMLYSGHKKSWRNITMSTWHEGIYKLEIFKPSWQDEEIVI
tara:strand:+ start:45 stop:545 length:501 start_codon:yes stop_codon:yes gene_type:complete